MSKEGINVECTEPDPLTASLDSPSGGGDSEDVMHVANQVASEKETSKETAAPCGWQDCDGTHNEGWDSEKQSATLPAGHTLERP